MADEEIEQFIVRVEKLENNKGKAICSCDDWKKNNPNRCKHSDELCAEENIEQVLEGSAPVISVPETLTPSAPVDVVPMFPIVTTKPFNANKYTGNKYTLHETHSGIRLFITVQSGKISAKAFSLVKGNVEKLGDYSLPQHLIDSLAKLPDAVYDGKIYLEGGKTEDISTVDSELLSIVLFDVIEIANNVITNLPFSLRREKLEELFWISNITADDSLFLVETFPASDTKVAEILSKSGFGAILKDNLSTYVYGNSDATTRWVLFIPPKNKVAPKE